MKKFQQNKVTRLKDGNMIIEVPDKKSCDIAMKIKMIGDTPVTVSPHHTMNSSQGVITHREMKNFQSNDDIVNFFNEYGVHSQGIPL